MWWTNILSALANSSVPQLLVLAGIAFWILAIAGSLGGKITIAKEKQRLAAVLGSVFFCSGLLLFVASIASSLSNTPVSKSGPQSAEPVRHVEVAGIQIEFGKPGPGVNCTGKDPTTGKNKEPTPDEVVICKSTALENLDMLAFALYNALFRELDKTQQDQLKIQEESWVNQRGLCGGDEKCLLLSYQGRLEQLNVWRNSLGKTP
jgi:hypothetical protein